MRPYALVNEQPQLSSRAGYAIRKILVLIAIEAPLGWPKQLAETLINHSAGMPIETPANAMFRRTTDVFISTEAQKDSARCRRGPNRSHRLRSIGHCRQSSRGTWNANSAGVGADVSRVAAIEVYPAATLVAHRIRSTGYKKPGRTEERHQIVEALHARLTIGESVPDLTQSADLVDAAVCVLAGADFLSGVRNEPPGSHPRRA
jgi:hypothetical protein